MVVIVPEGVEVIVESLGGVIVWLDEGVELPAEIPVAVAVDWMSGGGVLVITGVCSSMMIWVKRSGISSACGSKSLSIDLIIWKLNRLIELYSSLL